MWARLRDWHAVSNTTTKVQLQTKLSTQRYSGQSVQDYVDSFEEIFNRLAAMDSPVSDDMLVAMLFALFGDKRKSPFGHVISSLQTIQNKIDWETATARLIQEYED